jgi:outer membrane protein OmpA-like peptidoglycan-associated protein
LFSDTSISRIEIVGYTDNQGSEEYNAHLSKQRANSVANLISAKFLIASSLIRSFGKGIL